MVGLAFGAAVVGSSIVGCAGDTAIGGNPGVPNVDVSGGVTQASSTSVAAHAADPAAPQQVQVTGVGLVSLPQGIALSAGEKVSVFSAGQTLLQGLTTLGGAAPVGRGDDTGKIYVLKNGTGGLLYTGVRLLPNGRTNGAFLLPDGMYSAFVSGPLAVVRGAGRLDIGSIQLGGEVANGVASLPTAISGKFPNNGGTSFSLSVGVQMPVPNFADGVMSLTITHGNGILSQTRSLVNGQATFKDFKEGSNSRIPVKGVDAVKVTYTSTGGGG